MKHLRRALTLAAACCCTWAVAGAGAIAPARMVILGVDGMDPKVLAEFMRQGLTPNLSRLAATGGFVNLGTSTPPQSPVAWSTFITGMDPGGHGIFDFLHLDRDTLTPYMSTSRVSGTAVTLPLGRWRIPLVGQETHLLRHGTAFWELLEQEGVHTRMFQIPANYPPVETSGRAISGMGTPDLQGTPGVFTLYTDDPAWRGKTVSGGTIENVALDDGVVRSHVNGPPNALLKGSPLATAELEVLVDRENPVALVSVGGERRLMQLGEWTEWLPVTFDLVPNLASVNGMVRFYLKQLRPHLMLYMSPVNIDPRDPAQVIASPAEYARELTEAAGPFYTEEMPEDTKALRAGVLDPREFLTQSQLVLDEHKRLLDAELRRFSAAPDRALLFFYFGSIDQRHHMMYRQADLADPLHAASTPSDLVNAMRDTYVEIDAEVGRVMSAAGENTAIVVMSDHGFSSFRRQVNLNRWLELNGYLRLKDSFNRDRYEWLQGISWSTTRAFAIGLNSLYINVRGREKQGIVAPAKRAALAAEIAEKLRSWVDPETGQNVVTQVVLREQIYHGPYVEEAPDIVVGYAPGYRASWDTTTGKIPVTLLEPNVDEWTGDHCIDSRAVPGVLLSNLPLQGEGGALGDLTVSVLKYFGVAPAAGMGGRPLFQGPVKSNRMHMSEGRHFSKPQSTSAAMDR
jgi:predicted AlkP superfamily phosphohydrolase/phosphomutase